MTARIAYLTALAGRGGGVMLQPPRRLFPAAGFPDADLGFQHVMTGPLDEDEPRYPTPTGPTDSQPPGQSQAGGQRRDPAEPVLGRRGDRRPAVAGRAEPAPPSGATAAPPRQLDRAGMPASVPRAPGNPRAPRARAAAEARTGSHGQAALPGGPAGTAPWETAARVADAAAGAANTAAGTVQRVADNADVRTASGSAAGQRPLPSRAVADPGPRAARGRPSAMSAAGVGPGYPQALQDYLPPADPALTVPASAVPASALPASAVPASAGPGSGPAAVSEAQPAPARRGRHGLRGVDAPQSAPQPGPRASPQAADGPAALPGGPAEQPAGTPADATRDRGRAPQRASAVTVPPAANLEPPPRFPAAARTLDQPEPPAGLAVAPRTPQPAGARGVPAPAKAPVPILSIGTIEVTLTPPRDPVPADTSHREPRRPPQQLNRGVGPRFGQGQK